MAGRIGLWALGGFLLLVGLALAIGGGWLAGLGGSPYYVLAGIGCIVAGILICRGRRLGAQIYLCVFLATLLWAVWEVGTDFWQLLPRVGGPLAVALYVVMPWVQGAFRDAPARKSAARLGEGTVAVAGIAVLIGAALFPLNGGAGEHKQAAGLVSPDEATAPNDWEQFGRTQSGTRYSPASAITPQNVGKLQVAWTYRTGDIQANYPNTKSAFMFEATPIKVDDTLYFCTPHDVVVALDADTGKERWRYDPKTNDQGVAMLVCRGVSYFKAQEAVADCPTRVLVDTIDGRMIALDAKTGKPCRSFGTNGQISLLEGLGPTKPGFQYSTSPATIIGNAAVVGGFVLDGVATNLPSGVVRAFDARNGKLLWAWDLGRPEDAAAAKPGAIYTPGTPNAWTLFSADPKLGLVYVPTGNSTPDFFGGTRTALADRYSSSVVALDAVTGKARWSFQTVHHDLWDYDVGSQPVLIDMPTPKGTVPALIQPTKHGDIYLLDRRDGKPLAQVEERPVPKGDVPGERYAPTQPWSTGMPSFTPPPLTEADMWGATPLDQLWCRIQYKQMRYQGKFTPPSTHRTLQFPGNFGVIDWGSVAVDEARGIMIVNSSAMPLTVRLVPRKEADKQIIASAGNGHAGLSPQYGTPYAVDFAPFMSPLGLPCNAPPWGKLSAVDLKTRQIVWQTKLGTTRDHAPLGIAVPGVFNLGGAVVTKGGVTFIAATIDHYLRAFDTQSGKLLWEGRLPAGGQASPMSYTSSRTGKQYVVIAAGGHQFMGTKLGDQVVAYALPD
ncbi:membrane-bound PQQ-dependent dehydrogenase, glucose/quinate/shikimate family [Sphingobium estronivorans]|uniref:membrane-bound PQQ-dependent dehydrogenase, glucose/quinate/shikimate family n=1 Tax=Sphingobium estronivorans TaxID=1577690 RepID=UPI00123BC367|nr:membrane-bound PQQ-dependent dehydrogenase, glucose/quinate/shikimate family [Sphingobium estronivorans]